LAKLTFTVIKLQYFWSNHFKFNFFTNLFFLLSDVIWGWSCPLIAEVERVVILTCEKKVTHSDLSDVILGQLRSGKAFTRRVNRADHLMIHYKNRVQVDSCLRYPLFETATELRSQHSQIQLTLLGGLEHGLTVRLSRTELKAGNRGGHKCQQVCDIMLP